MREINLINYIFILQFIFWYFYLVDARSKKRKLPEKAPTSVKKKARTIPTIFNTKGTKTSKTTTKRQVINVDDDIEDNSEDDKNETEKTNNNNTQTQNSVVMKWGKKKWVEWFI